MNLEKKTKNKIKEFNLNNKEIIMNNDNGFKKNKFDKLILSNLNEDYECIAYKEFNTEVSNSIITKILRQETKQNCGIYSYVLDLKTTKGIKHVPIVRKVKLPDQYYMDVLSHLFKTLGNEKLDKLFQKNKEITGFCDTHMHETGFYSYSEQNVLEHCPKIYGVEINEDKQKFTVLMEELSDSCYFDIKEKSINWNDKKIKAGIEAIADIHATYMDRFNEISKNMHLRKIDDDLIDYPTAGTFLRELTYHNSNNFSQFINKDVLLKCDDFIDNLSKNVAKMKAFPMSLSHNDFNNRNVCFKRGPIEDKFIVYDWELLSYQNPQYDVVEFLLSVLDEKSTKEEFYKYIDFYRGLLEQKTGKEFNKNQFMELVEINAEKLAFIRFNMHLLVNDSYQLGHIMKSYKNFIKIFI